MLTYTPEDQAEILDTLERDSEILRATNVMDYSLLFAIEKNASYMQIRGTVKTRSASKVDPKEDEELARQLHKNFHKSRHTFLSKNGKFIYHLAIIDYL